MSRLVDEAAASCTVASGPTVSGSADIMSAAVEANALRRRFSSAPAVEEDRAPEEVHVVGDVEVALVVGQHQVGLGDDSGRRPSESTTGTPGSSCSLSSSTTSSTLASVVTDAGEPSMSL